MYWYLKERIFTSLKDWVNNAEQGVGLPSEQYREAVILERKLKDTGIELEAVAGHSLGGGLAALAGADAGVPTYTYNAAGVHPNTFKNNNVNPENAKNIEAYSGDHDFLTGLSDNRELILGHLLICWDYPAHCQETMDNAWSWKRLLRGFPNLSMVTVFIILQKL